MILHYGIRLAVVVATLCITLAIPLAGSAQERDSDGSPDASAAHDLVPSEVPSSMRDWLITLDPELRRSALGRLRRMPSARREMLFERWSGMSEVDRGRLQVRMENRARDRMEEPRRRGIGRDSRSLRDHARTMTPGERRRFLAGAERWRKMKSNERAAMRSRLLRFHELSEPEQSAMIERTFPDASPAEREKKLEQLRAARPGAAARD